MAEILVFNVAAEHSGALTVLEEFYEIAKQDKENDWHFILSLPELEETNNIKISNYRWIKKSKFHRLVFDYIVSVYLIMKFKPNRILSLQNITVPICQNKQIVYLHQSLPFSKVKYSMKDSKDIWFYQNIYSLLVMRSIKKCKAVIVQANWMKKAIVTKTNCNPDKVFVSPPKINITVSRKFDKKSFNNEFIYPASAGVYKNHKIIVEACSRLVKMNKKDFKVIFTITGNENKNIELLFKRSKEESLPILWVGKLKRDEVLKLYSKSVLVFPSLIETVGLPLIEAKNHETPIISVNLPYSREALDGYHNVRYFDHNNVDWLVKIMTEVLEETI